MCQFMEMHVSGYTYVMPSFPRNIHCQVQVEEGLWT